MTRVLGFLILDLKMCLSGFYTGILFYFPSVIQGVSWVEFLFALLLFFFFPIYIWLGPEG